MDSTSAPLSVFVSSTIDDLKDLRSALKYWLGEIGLEVRMSEFNDFGRRPEHDTFESCFAAIKDSDYFTLIVGGRKGADYGDSGSVTQEEFRTAVRAAAKGRLRIIILIRDEVMTALHERRELRKALETKEIRGSDEGRTMEEILDTTPSRTIQDTEFTKTFVKEIRETRITTVNTPSAGALWTYRFTDFSDIVTALRTAMPIRRTLRTQALIANMQWELYQCISELSFMMPDHSLLPLTDLLESVQREISLSNASLDESIHLSPNQVSAVCNFTFLAGGPAAALPTVALNEAIRSGAFLEFDNSATRLVASDELSTMYRLVSEIERCRITRTAFSEPPFNEALGQLLEAKRLQRGLAVSPVVLGTVFATQSSMTNVLRLAVSLLRFFDSGRLDQLTLLPSSPFEKSPDNPEASDPTHDDIRSWLSTWIGRSFLTGLPFHNKVDDPDMYMKELSKFRSDYPAIDEALQPGDDLARQMIVELKNSDEYRQQLEKHGSDAATQWFVEQLSKRIEDLRSDQTKGVS